MRAAVIILLVATVLGGSTGSSIRSRRAAEDFVRSITYNYKPELKQTVKVTDDEAMFKVENGLSAVIDYKQNLYVTAVSGGEVCHVADFDAKAAGVPTPEQIKAEIIKSKGVFKKPSEKLYYHMEVVDSGKPVPTLLKLSKTLCEDKKILRVKMTKNDGSGRQKREVGAGEVVVIALAIIGLFLLG